VQVIVERCNPALRGSAHTMSPADMSTRRVKDIGAVAAAAKVSVATVSRTLQRPEVVSEGTRRRVYEAIEAIGYTPNAQARNLRTARTRLVIALVPDIANPFFSEVIRGMEQVAHESGYSVLLGDTQSSHAREQAYADMVAARQVDGLITLMRHLPKIQVTGRLPIVNACEYVKNRDITSVRVDNVAAARSAVSHLLTLGHRRIAFVSGPADSPISIDRRHGYEAALKQAGLSPRPSLIAPGDFSMESGVRAIEYFLAQKSKFSAVFCSNDEMAIGAMRALATQGLNVPGDVSVVGFDDIRFARYTSPPLTTIAQPKNELGREAMRMLIELLNDPSTPVLKRVLSADLVVRGSTAQCAEKADDNGRKRGEH
jgi:LacI family transcriptional regulator, repressor for deo operon, udp, cdd, tsx, nupC, and nupG